MRIYGITGWKNAGKTLMVERLLAQMGARGLTVSTVKHAHHEADLDTPGRDSHRHRQAGATEVLLISGARWALMHELRGTPEPPLDQMLARLSPVDLVLIEGYKSAPHPKLEVHRGAIGKPPLALDNPTIRAVASDVAPAGLSVPLLPIDDPAAITDFILSEVGL